MPLAYADTDADDYDGGSDFADQYYDAAPRRQSSRYSIMTPMAKLTAQVQSAREAFLRASSAQERARYAGELVTLIDRVVNNPRGMYGLVPLRQKFDLIDARNFYVVIQLLSEFQAKHPKM